MQLVALRDWYPKYAEWTGTFVPVEDRVGWVIHHTVGGNGDDPERYARIVADLHHERWGVPGGYNYLIGEDGVIRVMCGFSFRGVHSGTHEWNYKSLGLAFQGDFREAPPTELMLDAAREIIADTPIPTDQWGHRDVRPEPTTCPGGYLYDLLPLEDDMPLSEDDVQRVATAVVSRVLTDSANYADPPGLGRQIQLIRANVNATLRAVNNLDEIDSAQLAADVAARLEVEGIPQATIDALVAELTD